MIQLKASLERLLELDRNISRKTWVAERPGMLRCLAIFFAHSGDSWFIGLGLILILFMSPSEWRYRAAWLLTGLLVTAVVVFIIKLVVRRKRPEGDWGKIYRRTDPHSFPSGHAARASMMAVLGIFMGPGWLGWILLIWAPLVMLARVAMGVHYLSDVAVGALLGIGMAVLVFWIIPRIAVLI